MPEKAEQRRWSQGHIGDAEVGSRRRRRHRGAEIAEEARGPYRIGRGIARIARLKTCRIRDIRATRTRAIERQRAQRQKASGRSGKKAGRGGEGRAFDRRRAGSAAPKRAAKRVSEGGGGHAPGPPRPRRASRPRRLLIDRSTPWRAASRCSSRPPYPPVAAPATRTRARIEIVERRRGDTAEDGGRAPSAGTTMTS